MPDRRHRLGHGLAGAIGLLLLAGSGRPAVARGVDQQDFATIQRGRYLTTVADCAACHTLPGSGKPFAGGRAIETPFGNVLAPNITPDRDTGIGAWSDAQFDAAVRRGIRRDGQRLYPAMPFPYYAKMSRQDVLAIRAYLATVKPVRHEMVADQLPFPFNIRFSMWAWDALYFDKAPFKSDKTKSAAWNRGVYLVEGPAHCGACHTPKDWLGGDEISQALRGYVIQGWLAPDLTNDKRGLGRWSIDDIVAYLRTGHNDITAATGPMAEMVAVSGSQMRDADLRAIATYLKDPDGARKPADPSLVQRAESYLNGNGSKSSAASPLPASDPVMTAGRAVYRDVCSACHGLHGHGVPKLFPSLAASSLVRSEDPTTLIRLVLEGARSAATKAEPTAPGMPGFAWQLNDNEVAAVLTYARNSWGAAAPAVSPDEVHRDRKSLAHRND